MVKKTWGVGGAGVGSGLGWRGGREGRARPGVHEVLFDAGRAVRVVLCAGALVREDLVRLRDGLELLLRLLVARVLVGVQPQRLLVVRLHRKGAQPRLSRQASGVCASTAHAASPS